MSSPQSGQSPPDTSSPNGNGITIPHAALEITSGLSVDSPDSQVRASTSSPEMLQAQASNTRGADPLMDMLFTGWDPDLPDPDVLNH